MFIIGSLLIASALYLLGFDVASAVVVVVGMVAQSIPGRFVIGVGGTPTTGRARARRTQRSAGAQYLHEVAVDLGLEQETAAERQERIEEERQAYNKFAAGGTLGTGQETYIDYDGQIVNILTGEIVGRARKAGR